MRDDGPWWRLKPGLKGLKPFMSDKNVRGAIEAGYGWVRHYEPVCSDCPKARAALTAAVDSNLQKTQIAPLDHNA